MEIEVLRKILAWCSLFNLILLVLWWGGYVVAGGWIRELHGKWFKLSRETFDAIHYSGMAVFKLQVLIFNVIPYLVLRFFF